MVNCTPLSVDFQQKTEQSFCFTVVQTNKPTYLSKQYTLNDEGIPTLSGKHGVMYSGRYDVQSFPNINALAEFIKTATPDMALCTGKPLASSGQITAADKPRKGAISRTKNDFPHSEGTTLVVFDYDPPKDGSSEPLTREQLRDQLCAAMPELMHAPTVMTDSASSHLYRTKDGVCVKGAGGLRMYVVISDGRDVPKLFDRLEYTLWTIGLGRIEISKAGTLLKRTIVDLSFKKPAQLDFCAGAKCGSGLEQRRPEPTVFNNDAPPLDTAKVKVVGEAEKRQLAALVMTAKTANGMEAKAVRDAYIKEMLVSQFGADAFDGAGVVKAELRDEVARKYYRLVAACSGAHLPLDFGLYMSTGRKVVTVDALMRNPADYKGEYCADPLEPDYNGGSLSTAHINVTDNGEVWIYSHAHGGVSYTLADLPAIAAGKELRFAKAGGYGWVTRTEPLSTKTLRKIADVSDYYDGRRALNSVIIALLHEGIRNPKEVWAIVEGLDEQHVARVYWEAKKEGGDDAFEYGAINFYLNALDTVSPIGSFDNPTVAQLLKPFVADDIGKPPAFMRAIIERKKAANDDIHNSNNNNAGEAA
jgi:hypothetical protein